MTAEAGPVRRQFSRRGFLGTVGLGAATAATGVLPGAGADAAAPHPTPATFGRLFAAPSFADATPDVVAALTELGRPGGLLDAGDALDRSAKDLIVDLALSAGNRNNPDHTAGTTFVGQFLDHDITFDVTSQLAVATAPETSPNTRTPSFDLESVYGAGPNASPQLYDPVDLIKLAIESGGLFEDLPRRADGRAVIGDPRNDSNVIIAGLHAAFILVHNRAVDVVRVQGDVTADPEVFAAARRFTVWHYHWLIVHEFLPLFIGHKMTDDILAGGRRFYRPKLGRAFIPVEFSGAAYRFGHSMVRPSYRANLAGDKTKPFFALVFDPTQEGAADPKDLRGGARAARRFIGWQTFFDFGDGEVKPNKRIDTKLSTPLFTLPLGAIASHDLPISLPQRTLLRHLTWSLPSGQEIARKMGVDPLGAGDLDELKAFGAGFEWRTPLWYYVLKEAELVEDGLHLGPVGGRIVGEVILGLLQTDPSSYLTVQPDWRPSIRSRSGGQDFRMVDLLTFAGVDPDTRGQ